MNQLLTMVRGVVLLDTGTYERLRDRKDAMKRGVFVLPSSLQHGPMVMRSALPSSGFATVTKVKALSPRLPSGSCPVFGAA